MDMTEPQIEDTEVQETLNSIDLNQINSKFKFLGAKDEL